MKSIKIEIIAVLLGASILSGADSINEQIEVIQKASPQERVELMNKLKLQLATMNEQERSNAISALRLEMGDKAINVGTSPVYQRMQQIQSARQENFIQQNNTLNTQFPRMRR
jgi:hypothetical protein